MSFFNQDIDTSKLEEDLGKELGGDEPQEEQNEEVQEEVTSIKLGDKEYSQEELESLVGLGTKAKEIEANHGGLDKFVSEFGKKSQRIGELNKEIENLKGGQTTTQTQEGVDPYQQAREAAQKVGLVMKDDLDSYYEQRRQAEKLLDSASKLEKEIDGSDGRPKFESEKILEFMKSTGATDPEKAYIQMHLDDVARWKAEQILKGKNKGIITNTDTVATKTPPKVGVNADNLHNLISEEMSANM
jgi:hypothetical protein